MKIQDNILTVNPFSRPGKSMGQITGIVVHYVGNAGSTALSNRNYFENLKVGKNGVYASSHYIIGLDGEIIRCVPENEMAYHAGNSTYNQHCIGIECCHPDTAGKFTDKTYNSLIELCVDICKRYGLDPRKDVVRHYDVTGKDCPRWYVRNSSYWDRFLFDVGANLKGDAVSGIAPAAVHWAKKHLDSLVTKGVVTSPEANSDLDVEISKGQVFALIDKIFNKGVVNDGH